MKKMKFIDSVRVGSPCSEDWNEMTGDEKVRYCSHCAKAVNNLSEMTRKEALRLVRNSSGNLCIRYIQHPVSKAPVFAEQLIQISRRAPRMAAGVMTASLSLSTLAYAQGGSAARFEPGAATERSLEKSCPDAGETDPRSCAPARPDAGSGSVTGTVVDPNGAVVSGAEVVLLDEEGNELRRSTANEVGNYEIDAIPTGLYSIAITSPGFTTFSSKFALREGTQRTLNATLDVADTVGGVMVVVDEFEGPLASAVSRDAIDEVRDLIARGEDVNRKEEDGTTPLFPAVENGNIEMVRLLLDFGAKVNARNDDKETPLMKVDSDATRELVELLIRNGAKVNARSEDGNTALILAAENSTAEVVQALIDAGADIDLQNEEGVTALMKAADNEDIEKVRALINAGADVNLKDDDGDNAWDYTANTEIEELLVAHGVMVEPEVEVTPPSDGQP